VHFAARPALPREPPGVALRVANTNGCCRFNHPWTMYVVRNAVDVFTGNIEPDGRMRRPGIGAASKNDNDRFTIHFAKRQSPGPGPAIVVEEVSRVRKLSSKSFSHVEPRIRAGQLANPISIAPVEPFDIELHDALHLGAHLSSRSGRRRRFRQLGSSTVERRLHAAHR
jgi:hypothetical protein